MAKVPQTTIDPILFLALRKYPLPPERPYAKNRFGHDKNKEARDAYREKLRLKTADEINALYEAERQKQQEEARAKWEEGESTRHFNVPQVRAEPGTYEYWAKAALWSIDEATALLLERNPGSVNLGQVRPYERMSAFAKKYCGLHELLRRAVEARQLGQSNPPARFVAWAKGNKIDIPKGLEDAVEDLGLQVADWRSLFEQAKKQLEECRAKQLETVDWAKTQIGEASDKTQEVIAGYKDLLADRDGVIEELQAKMGQNTDSLGARERESLLKLIIGMAVKGYAHDPKASRSGTAAEISGDLERLGISLHVDTIRKYLQETADLLPGEAE
jgi:hypothetical protein